MDLYAARLQQAESNLLLASRAQDSLVFHHAPLLFAILEQLPPEQLTNAALVCRAWNRPATDLLLRTVRLSTEGVESFQRLLADHPGVSQRIRSFELNKSSLPIVDELPSIAPNLTSLTIASCTRLQSADIAQLILALPHLRHLTITGQDSRSRRRRLVEVEPEGEIGKAMRFIANASLASADGSPKLPLRLRSLSVLNTPLKMSSLDYFLEVQGSSLECLNLQSCSLGPKAIALVEQWCPRLCDLRLDTLLPTNAPPMTPRPNLPPLDFDPPSFALSHALTSLHFASLPALDPSAFAHFSEIKHASLHTLSLSHCSSISAAHLSHFTRIRRLRIVACSNIKSIPVFPDRRGRADLGEGCKELRQLSVLGSGISLGNLWDLAMMARVDISAGEERERRTLGLGGRGLKKLTVDGAVSRDRRYSVSGVTFTFPAGLGSPPPMDDIESLLPRHLLPPTRVRPHLETNLLDPTLPSHALLSVLLACEDLEELSLFGHVGGDPFPLEESMEIGLLQRARSMLVGGLDYVPLLGPWLAESRRRAAGGYSPPVGVERKEDGGVWRGMGDGAAAREGNSQRLKEADLESLRALSSKLITVHT